jgi:hypothetical protein
MEASMCSCDFDGEPIYPCTLSKRKARKPHKCEECGEPIKPGETYEHLKGLCDGYWVEWKTCTLCERIRRDFCAPLGCLQDELYYALGFNYVTGEEDPSFKPLDSNLTH